MIGALLAALAVAHAGDTPRTPRELTVETAARPWGTGVGVLLGKPSGVTVAYRPDHDAWLVQAAVGYNPVFGSMQVQADLLANYAILHLPQVPSAQVPLYVGVGAVAELGEYRALGHQQGGFGVRAPVGITYMDRDLPLDVFMEAALVVGLVPYRLLDLDAAAGVRVYF